MHCQYSFLISAHLNLSLSCFAILLNPPISISGGRGLSVNFVHGGAAEISPRQPHAAGTAAERIDAAELHIRTRRPKNFGNRMRVDAAAGAGNRTRTILDVSPEFRTLVGVEGGEEMALPLHSSR